MSEGAGRELGRGESPDPAGAVAAPAALRTGPWLVPVGALIATAGAMCGIGGGIFAVPILHWVSGLPMRRAVATSVAMVLANSLVSTAVELMHPGRALPWDLILCMGVGAIAGAEIGYRASRRIEVHWIKLGFAVLAAVAGLRLLLDPGLAHAGAMDSAGLSVIGALWAVAAGVAGGCLTPLLGLGGGIVMVPAVHLVLPSLGFNAARAASLAVAALSSGRSLRLYRSEGAIEWRAALWLCCGALVGSAAGVILVHDPSVATLAGRLLGGILCFVALRFSLEWGRRIAAGRGRPPQS